MKKLMIEVPKEINFLVVDDLESMRKMAIHQLSQMGFKGNVFQASNVSEAKTVVAQEKIDFILSDWNMPEESGYDFLLAVRAMPKYKNTPFLMVTTVDDVGDMLNAINAGASNYLVKPWKPEDFEEKLKYAWEKHAK